MTMTTVKENIHQVLMIIEEAIDDYENFLFHIETLEEMRLRLENSWLVLDDQTE